jgi:hypothetical protein
LKEWGGSWRADECEVEGIVLESGARESMLGGENTRKRMKGKGEDLYVRAPCSKVAATWLNMTAIRERDGPIRSQDHRSIWGNRHLRRGRNPGHSSFSSLGLPRTDRHKLHPRSASSPASTPRQWGQPSSHQRRKVRSTHPGT